METLIHGGAAAIASSVSVSMIDAKDWGIGTANFFKVVCATFAVNGGLRFFQWWSANPLPPDDDTKPPFEQPQISLNPIGQVQPINKPNPNP